MVSPWMYFPVLIVHEVFICKGKILYAVFFIYGKSVMFHLYFPTKCLWLKGRDITFIIRRNYSEKNVRYIALTALVISAFVLSGCDMFRKTNDGKVDLKWYMGLTYEDDNKDVNYTTKKWYSGGSCIRG